MTASFRDRFEEKYTYPALEITYLAVDKKYQHIPLPKADVWPMYKTLWVDE